MDWSPGYREQQPPASLLPSVTCLWARVVGPGAAASTAVLPDACVDLIWEQGRGVFVAGPDTGPAPAVTPPGTVLAALRFAPGAAGPALGLPMSDLLNKRVDAADLGTWPAAELARALPGSLPPAQALRVLARMAAALPGRRRLRARHAAPGAAVPPVRVLGRRGGARRGPGVGRRPAGLRGPG